MKDVIHTNAMVLSIGVILKEIGFGIQSKCGHVDYYPNGGRTQPGCVATNQQIWESLGSLLQNWNFDDATSAIACSHNSAPRYFIDSIANDCQFTAYPCKSFDAFSQGECTRCSGDGTSTFFLTFEKKLISIFYLISKKVVTAWDIFHHKTKIKARCTCSPSPALKQTHVPLPSSSH